MQIKNIGAAALPALFHLFEAVSGRPCLRLSRCPCTLLTVTKLYKLHNSLYVQYAPFRDFCQVKIRCFFELREIVDNYFLPMQNKGKKITEAFIVFL